MEKDYFELTAGTLTRENIFKLYRHHRPLRLSKTCYENILAAANFVDEVIDGEQQVYGINTGFGLLSNVSIKRDELHQLQENIVLSHAAGVGTLLDDDIIALTLLLKINSLALGYSGIRLETIDYLIKLYNHHYYPCVPAKGSVGASGDLAPLAHIASCLLGYGNFRVNGEIIPAKTGLKKLGLTPLKLHAKEGLALLNGTQVSTAIALSALCKTESLFSHAVLSGSMTTDVTLGTDIPFDARIHDLRGHPTQIKVAKIYRTLLANSDIRNSHKTCDKVQDPYSIRCQPQVMGACLAHIEFAANSLTIEANACTDNPIILSKTKETLSGGNFHAQPVAMAADTLALAISEIGALSERRIAMMMDKHFSGLPPFLVENSGLNSGFMIPDVTATALASENKALAHPVSIDSLPTSANQEDHVSMATYAAQRLHPMITNTRYIIAIELLAACQGLDLRAPLKSSPLIEKVHNKLRESIPVYRHDRYFATDIESVHTLLQKEVFIRLLPTELTTFL